MTDEIFYAAALHEYESGNIDPGLKAKAYVAADGVKDRIKVEYLKLRVKQLKAAGRNVSLQHWYTTTSDAERTFLVVASILLIPLFGLGLIPLGILVWLRAGEKDELAKKTQSTTTSSTDTLSREA